MRKFSKEDIVFMKSEYFLSLSQGEQELFKDGGCLDCLRLDCDGSCTKLMILIPKESNDNKDIRDSGSVDLPSGLSD
jgi:hypothetical protein